MILNFHLNRQKKKSRTNIRLHEARESTLTTVEDYEEYEVKMAQQLKKTRNELMIQIWITAKLGVQSLLRVREEADNISNIIVITIRCETEWR